MSHLCECLCLCGNTGILIMWLLCVSACLSMEKLPLIGLGVSESRIMNQNPAKHWNSTEVHCGYIELGLLHCTCALLNSVHWFSLNLNTVHTGERNLSNIAKCAQCTKYLHNMKSQRCPQSREVSAPHEPFPAPAAPSVSVEGTVKHPLSRSRLWLLHYTPRWNILFQQKSTFFSNYTRLTTLLISSVGATPCVWLCLKQNVSVGLFFLLKAGTCVS